MASIGNIEITKCDDNFTSGTAFLLQKTSPISITVPCGNAVIQLEEGNPYVVARTTEFNNYDDAYIYGHEVTQKGLDILSMLSIADLVTHDSIDQHIVWWFKEDKRIMRIVDAGIFKWDAKLTLTTEDKDSDSNKSITFPVHHEAFRYFRLSQTTDDLFNAYRNMYLAFELLLSDLFPKGKELEIEWLKRALSSINQSILTSTMGNHNDLVEATIRELYTHSRLPLFHAKDGKNYYSPHQKVEERETVLDALSKLARIFILLVNDKKIANRNLGASMSTGLERVMMLPLIDKTYFILSNDDSQFLPDEQGFTHPRYEKSIKSKHVMEYKPVKFHKFSILGTIEIDEIKKISSFCRIELVTEIMSLVTVILETPIYIEGIDNMECHLNFSQRSVSSPKREFAF